MPERVRCLVWIICHDRLLTNYSPMCDFCANTIEDELHELRDCPKAKLFWRIVSHHDARNDFYEGDLMQWIDYNMHSVLYWDSAINWPDFWAIACHALWSWRSKEKHFDNYTRPLNKKEAVFRFVSSYILAEQATKISTELPRSMTTVSWKCPPTGVG